jgi:hypothetical protein
MVAKATHAVRQDLNAVHRTKALFKDGPQSRANNSSVDALSRCSSQRDRDRNVLMTRLVQQ